MPNFYSELLRGVGFRDDNWKPLASNDPATSTIGWTIQFGGTATSDGDILTVSGASQSDVKRTVPGSLSTSTYPYLVVRVKPGTYTTPAGAKINFTDLSTQSVNFPTTPVGQFTTTYVTMTAGKTIASIELILNGSVSSVGFWDRVAICKSPPVTLSQNDLEFGTVTRAAFGFDHAELRLNNKAGKFVTGPNSFNFGDHLHVYLPRQFDPTAALYHAYGGYAEIQEPFMPNNEININSRGFGIGPGRILHLNQYQSQTFQAMINDMMDNSVNAASKNGVPIPTNYQLTRSFVQNLGSSVPIYLTNMQPTFNSWRELADIATSQLSPVAFFVDPAENLHWVPLGAQGAANWGTDPISANYATPIVYGNNIILFNYRRDTQSVRNRVHYFGVSQTPGVFDSWTEFTNDTDVGNNWGSERVNANTTVQFHSSDSQSGGISALGRYSVFIRITSAGTAAQPGGAVFYPKAQNLGLNVNTLGSAYSPPLFDFCFRFVSGATPLRLPGKIFFATDSSNRFEYNLVHDDGNPTTPNFLNADTLANLPQNIWFHLYLPIGSHGGTVFLNPPLLNGISIANFTGQSGYQLANVGTPSWSNINYIGFDFPATGAETNGNNYDCYFDGWRIIGGRWRIAYDNRASPPRYPDASEVMIWDPIAKADSLIKSYAAAELYRGRNAIARGTVTIPISGDMYPEQQVQVTNASAGLNSTFLRVSEVIHRFSPSAMVTEAYLTDDFTNSQPLERWKFYNAIMGMGENAVLSREVYDLKTALIDSGFVPVLDPYT